MKTNKTNWFGVVVFLWVLWWFSQPPTLWMTPNDKLTCYKYRLGISCVPSSTWQDPTAPTFNWDTP